MASLKDLKNRIDSVKSTQKITRAMQMVAAAKLRKAQERAEAARPYAERMDKVLAGVSAAYRGREDAPKLLGGNGKDQIHLLIVATAERGLCGGFNSSIARLARNHARALMDAGKSVKIITVGKKGHDALKRIFENEIIEAITLREVKAVGYSNAAEIGAKVLALYDAEEFDIATLFYSRFESVMTQTPTAQQLIPASFEEENGQGASEAGDSLTYDYEPSEDEILADLLPRNVSVQLFRALLENGAGEMGAKMTAMDNATRNAGEMIDALALSYNRQRQAQITKELIEIISGAEAL